MSSHHNFYGFNPADDNPELPPEEQQRLRKQCEEDIYFWFNEFCFTYDPREADSEKRFWLYPYQDTLVQKLVQHIENGEDVLIEKSRDMGITWVVALVFQWYWMFKPGSAFLIGSKRKEDVDRLGDPASIMEKIRYNLDRQPRWLMPEGYQKRFHSQRFKLINPQNGNTIMGESTTPNFSRGGRYKAVFMDEFAFWNCDDLAYASAGQSTNTRIVVSTPHGRNNKFADLRFGDQIPVLTYRWDLHPKKEEEWYEQQKRRMTEDEIARELDLSYNITVRDRVYTEFTVQNKRDTDWNRHIPIVRSWDFGYHCPAVLFTQIDHLGRLHVLREVTGEREQVEVFAQRVIDEGNTHFPDALFEDVADPAGNQKNDKSDYTSIEILNQMGIYPAVKVSTVLDGIQLLRRAMTDVIDEIPGLIVSSDCEKTIMALEGGYRYNPKTETIVKEHPHADLMDCLRYVAIHKLDVIKGSGPRRRKARYNIKPGNPFTNY